MTDEALCVDTIIHTMKVTGERVGGYFVMKVQEGHAPFDCKIKVQYRPPQLAFLKNIEAFKGLLVEDANTNIKNMNTAHNNVNEIFTYLKAIIRKVVMKNERLNEKVQALERELERLDPANKLLQMKERLEDLGEVGQRLTKFVPFQTKIPASFTSKGMSPMIFEDTEQKGKNSKCQSKESMRKQVQKVEAFITRELAPNLTEDLTMRFALPKDMILSLYTKWNQLNGRQTHLIKLSALKTLLTNQIKRVFPKVDHNEKSYRGIAFRQDLMKGLDFAKEEQTSGLELQELKSVELEDFDDLGLFDQFQRETQN